MNDDKSMPELFREKRPEITEKDVRKAALATRVVTSWNSKPIFLEDGKIATLAIKWALGDGSTETILLARYPATVLLLLLEEMKKNDWTGTVTLPPDATRQ